jgi:hypothetical protein
MKRVAAISLGALLAASAFAQHTGTAGHAGGFSSGRGFVAPSFSAPGFSRSLGGAPAYRPNASARRSLSFSSPAPFGGTSPDRSHRGRPPYSGGGYRPYYSRGVYLVPGWLNSGFYDYGYLDPGEQQQAATPPPDAYAEQGAPDPQAYAQAPARPAYQGGASSSPGLPAADLQEQPQITLIFKDGRPDQSAQNYAVTRTTLYVLDGSRRREIPLDQLDLPQTEKTNRDAGVDFEVPATE